MNWIYVNVAVTAYNISAQPRKDWGKQNTYQDSWHPDLNLTASNSKAEIPFVNWEKQYYVHTHTQRAGLSMIYLHTNVNIYL